MPSSPLLSLNCLKPILLLWTFCPTAILTQVFNKLPIAEDCLGSKNPTTASTALPNCSFSNLINSNNNFTLHCIDNETLRVVGEYSTFRIKCSASYAIDLKFYGIQPTEAINMTWTKNVVPGSLGNNITFQLNILIRSNRELFHHFNKHGNTLIPSSKVYSRTGEFIIESIFNHTVRKRFFIYFEEDITIPQFLENPKTASVTLKNGFAKVPCFSSHFHSFINITYNSENWPIFYNTVNGSTTDIPLSPMVEKDVNQSLFECSMWHGDERIVKEKFIPKPEPYYYGLENLGGLTVKGDIEIGYNSEIDSSSQIHIRPWCRVQNLAEPTSMLASIPAHNFGYLVLVREFGLPKFVNRSYTAKLGTVKRALEREIGIAEGDELKDRFGVTFCISGNEHRLSEFGTSHLNGGVVKINYGLDWTYLPRDNAPINIFYLLKLENHTDSQPLYANTMMTFSCRIHEAVIVKPIMWYTVTRNNHVVEELIDYNWVGPFSRFSVNVTSDTVRVVCAGSFWYSSSWRNASMDLALIEGAPPTIASNVTTYSFKLGVPKQLLSCSVEGDPKPAAFFRFNNFDISSNAIRTDSHIILEFNHFTQAQAGAYKCIAINRFGRAEQDFQVEIAYDSILNYWLIVGLPSTLTLLVIIALFFYIRWWKAKQIGLTRQEIDEFINGTLQGGERQTFLNEYAHEFADKVPYNREYEIPKSKFQIDKSNILGKGAYGTVYRALLNGNTVAVKTVNAGVEKQYLKALLSEIKILIYLGGHDNVLKFLGAYTSELNAGGVYIFGELCQYGNLENYLKTNRKNFSVKANNSYTNSFGLVNLIQWSKDIGEGMNHLATKKVIHGDLAARNVLLGKFYQAKITDFGLSRQLYDYSNYVKRSQEPLPWRWMALESLRDMTFSSESDVWAYGVTLWEIFSLGEVPYPGYSWNMSFVRELEQGLRMSRPKHLPNYLYQTLMTNCWHENPHQRPSFQDILTILDAETFTDSMTLECDKEDGVVGCASNHYVNTLV